MVPNDGLILLSNDAILRPPQKLELLTPAAEQERIDLAIEQEEREAQARFEAAPGPKQGVARVDIKHGICRHCSKRTQLWLPASICTRCLRKAAAAAGLDIDKLPKEAL